jgi:hypothetical protein
MALLLPAKGGQRVRYPLPLSLSGNAPVYTTDIEMPSVCYKECLLFSW